MDDKTKEWLQYAENDLGVDRHLYKTYYPKPLEIICYHCQQSAEKAIKALIIYHGAEGGMPKKHNLSFLLTQIRNMEDIQCMSFLILIMKVPVLSGTTRKKK